LKKYKNSSDALLLIDPPYIEYSEKESNSSSSFTYGINFNHKELLNKMKNIEADFIYYNNHNPLIENFATRHSYRYSKNSRTYANGILERTVAIEICMSKLPKRSNQTSFNKQFDETLLVA
jgi:site-specific DNA-adenine methylase